MAHSDNSQNGKLLATGNLASSQRTIGGILGQMEAAQLSKTLSLKILSNVGLPEFAYEDPSFPISINQDFELLNEIRKYFSPPVSYEVRFFTLMPFLKTNMFGALGLAWQNAPSMRKAIEALIAFPQTNWGRSQMTVIATPTEERLEYTLDKRLLPFNADEDIEATYRYALLLEVTAGAAVSLDVLADRSYFQRIELPFPRPDDWHLVSGELSFEVVFDAPKSAAVYRCGFLNQVPKRAHDVSFRLAMKLVEKESELLANDKTFADQVTRWLWASTPPLKKPEIAKILGVSERSFTRRLREEGLSYNELLSAVQAERAKNLLRNPKFSISEIAYRMGYSEPAAFTRACTAWLGVTPTRWRQQQF